MKKNLAEIITNMADVVDTQYNTALSKLFSKPIMIELAENGSSEYLEYIIQKSGFIHLIENNITYAELFEMLFEYLQKYYRSEYVYKYAIVTNILFDKFSQCPTSYFNEFNVANSKADIVLINGTSYVYEIKTKYDSLERLASQIDSYQMVFDYVSVLVHSSHLNALEKLAEFYSGIGILLLTDGDEICTVREAQSNRHKVNPLQIFDCLRRDEYVSIVTKYFGDIGDIPNTRIYKKCKDLFSALSPTIAHKEMVASLHARTDNCPMKSLIDVSPHSLKPLHLGITLKKKQIESISRLLKSSISKEILSSA